MTVATNEQGTGSTPAESTPPGQAVPNPAQVFAPQKPATGAANTPAPTAPATPATGTVGADGYPENTPVAEMTVEQAAAYYRKQGRKHEDEEKRAKAELAKTAAELAAVQAKLAEFEQANMTDQQKAVAEAEQRGRQAALAEAASSMVETFFRANLITRLPGDENADRINQIIAGVHRQAFLGDDGVSVDAAKVSAYINAVVPAPSPAAPAPPVKPDMGQGGSNAPASGGLAAGAERARKLAESRKAPPITVK